MAIKPILFNNEMVRAILDGRKSCTRRLVKTRRKDACGFYVTKKADGTFSGIYEYDENESMFDNPLMPPYQPGDILYVRETWGISNLDDERKMAYIVYRASEEQENEGCREVHLPNEKFEKMYESMAESEPEWHPSIHMPKEAARIWLKVTDAKVERLQEMKPVDAIKEGAYPDCWDCLNTYGESGSQCCYGTEEQCSQCDEVMMEWEKLWNSTIKKSDLDRYGWDASPWVWVIEFERCEKPEGVENGHCR